MKRFTVTFLLAAAGGTTFAHVGDVTVPAGELCPPGTTQSVPSYTFEDGRLVRNGTVCQDRRYRN